MFGKGRKCLLEKQNRSVKHANVTCNKKKARSKLFEKDNPLQKETIFFFTIFLIFEWPC